MKKSDIDADWIIEVLEIDIDDDARYLLETNNSERLAQAYFEDLFEYLENESDDDDDDLPDDAGMGQFEIYLESLEPNVSQSIEAVVKMVKERANQLCKEVETEQ